MPLSSAFETGVRARGAYSFVYRILAKLVDLLVVFVLAVLVPYPLGPILGFGYSVLADGAPWPPFQGQSLGKKIFGIRAVSLGRRSHEGTYEPANFKESFLRNSPIGVATFFAIIPFWGWVILGLLGLPLMAIEVYLMMTRARRRRLGDIMGNTEVELL